MASATTPYRQDMTHPLSPSKTPSRRALGDLTPRALNSPASQTKNATSAEAIRARSPLKKVTSHIPNTFADKENLLASSNVASHGKKRGIDEVDDAEVIASAKMLAHGREESAWPPTVRLTTEAVQRHTENNPVGLADPGSPTERNTPTPEPEPIQASQKSNQSFSDFLNYELCASQQTDQTSQVDPVPTSIPTSVPTSQPVAPEKKSRAELLRTRLKFGLYKVKTNQASKSGDDIISTFEASASRSSDYAHASTSTPITSSADSSTHKVPNITISSPHREPVFVKANLDPFRPIGKLGQPPVQFAIPSDGTQISSRMVHSYDLSSSPPGAALPQSVSPQQLMSPMKRTSPFSTPPTSQRMRLGEEDEEDIEAPANAARQRLQLLKQESARDGDQRSGATGSVTGSVTQTTQGSAAKGLLELMSGKR